MARIEIVDEANAEGRLKEIYKDLMRSRGQLAEVHKAQSLRPESIVKHMDLYMEIMYSKSELTRAQREMIAVVVSSANGCEYCQIHHASALNKYWKNDDRVKNLRKDFNTVDLTPVDHSLCVFAEHLTLHPQDHENQNYIEPLKENGLSDSAILDCILVVAYFNFVNRIVLSTGIEIEGSKGDGFKY